MEHKKAKKTSEKKNIKRIAAEDHAFLLCTGVAIKSVKQLADELENVDDAVYWYHTQNGRNDFAQWTQDVFEAQELADKLRSSHSKDHIRATIYQYLLEHD